MKRQPTNTKGTSTKEQTPNLKRVNGDGWNGPRHSTERYCQLEGVYVLERSRPNSDSRGPWTEHPSLLTHLR